MIVNGVTVKSQRSYQVRFPDLSDAIQRCYRSILFAAKSTHTPQPDNTIRALVDDFLSAALALLLRTLPDLSRKIQAAVAVHQTRFVTGKLADYATAQRADH
jgi:hypothetical protein